MMKNKKSASALISDLKHKTRKAYNSEDKIRIIIEGMRGDNEVRDNLKSEIRNSIKNAKDNLSIHDVFSIVEEVYKR